MREASERSEHLLWVVCAAIVLVAHAAGAFALAAWHRPVEEGDLGTGSVVVELALMQVPAETHSDLPPGPEQVQADPSPDRPIKHSERQPEPLPEQSSDVMLPQKPDPQLVEVPREEASPAPATTAPQIAHSRLSTRTWTSEIVGILERNKRYPTEARARGEQGVTQLAFSIDRQGQVLESRIVSSSGSAALDQEALALLQRSQPFPIPPPELAGAVIKIAVPIRFNIR
ncbi:MAG TPA: energy transducer TonB [Xanthobacteraceae bacterium]|nr:energy transducer TonB [Xanthobacteraceae bacterium]